MVGQPGGGRRPRLQVLQAGMPQTGAAMRQPWELVADALRRAILDKTYRPGDQRPSENQLAAQHGASRPTVRRALQDFDCGG
jgi:DNA-binding GntR family transcriptional regulator